jgi:hypothetical protein
MCSVTSVGRTNLVIDEQLVANVKELYVPDAQGRAPSAMTASTSA